MWADALHAGWTAGRDELEYWHSTDYARKLVANGDYEFTVDGQPYTAAQPDVADFSISSNGERGTYRSQQSRTPRP